MLLYEEDDFWDDAEAPLDPEDYIDAYHDDIDDDLEDDYGDYTEEDLDDDRDMAYGEGADF